MTHSLLKVLVPIIYFLIFLGNNLFSQSNHNIRFTTINQSDGLSNNTVNTIIKDDLGFVWIGTNDGLCRYEASNNIKVFRAGNPEVEGGLQSSNIRVLFLDSKDNLWIGTRLGGLTKFHQPSGIWKTYRHDKNNDLSLSNDEILTITEDSKGRLWIGTEDGLNMFDYEKESFVSFKVDPYKLHAIKGKAILSVMEDDKGWIWAGTWAGGLNLLIPPKDGNIEKARFRTFIPSDKSEAQHIWKVFQDRQNRYWIGSRGAGLFLMEIPKEANDKIADFEWKPRFYNYGQNQNNKGITNDNLQDIFQDSKGNLWVGSVNGLSCISSDDLSITSKNTDLSSKPAFTFQHYFYEPNNLSSLTNNDVSTIFEDGQGLLWFGTYSGVSLYNWFINQFDVFEMEGVANTNTQNLFIDKEGIAWLGNGKNGIFKYDFQNQKKLNIDKNEILLLNSFITSLYSPDDRHLYIGTGKGITVLDMETNQTKNYPLPDKFQKQFNSFVIRSLFKDSQNRIWLASEQGLFSIDESDGIYTPYFHEPNNPKSISDVAVNQIEEDSNGDIWIATYNGLNRVVKTPYGEVEFERFKHDASNPENSIPSNRLVALERIDDVLYIGSNNGLIGYDVKGNFFINYSKENNKHSFQSIEKTEDGNLWAGTTEGIIFFNTKTKTFNQYEKGDGLGDVIFQTGSSHRDENGIMYFGSRRGITRFNPKGLIRNKIPPSVYITDIRKMNPDGEERLSGTYQKEIVMDHNDYYLSLDYAALNYNRSEKNKYAFMLEGFEENWNYIDNKISAVYTNLDHGEYNFRVKAANNDGVWNEEGVVLKIIKKPAFWETWWFGIGSLLSAIGLLLFGMNFYTKNIKTRNKVLQEYNDNLNKEIAQRKVVEKALQEREQHMESLVKQRTKELEVKNKEVESLLENIKERNDHLETEIAKRTQNLRKSNNELQRSNKDLEQFAYIASHDLQEPLRVVGNFIGLLKRRYKQHFDNEAIEYIDFAVDGVRRMSEQIKSILTFSRVSQKEINFKLIDINKIVHTKIHDLSEKVDEKNVKFKIDQLPEIVCEQSQIEMIFHNLISNAIKFNKNDFPLINISNNTLSSSDFWQFSVKDNGIGIPKEDQIKIFEIFKRLHSKKDYEGTGIGLALVQKIILRHEGKIWLESVDGEGTTFHFTISKHLKSKNQSKLKKVTEQKLYN